MGKPYHIPVLVHEVITALSPQPQGIYVDATFGGGGHTRAILEAEPTCRVIAFDWDKNALELNSPSLLEEFGERLTVHWSSFTQITHQLKKLKIPQVDGISPILARLNFKLHGKQVSHLT